VAVGRHARWLGVVALVAFIAGGCGGNGETKVSAGELKSRLLPPSQVHGFTLYRPFE
jgi:hypothetical protein